MAFHGNGQIFRNGPQLRSHGFGTLPHQADFQGFKITVSTSGILELCLATNQESPSDAGEYSLEALNPKMQSVGLVKLKP